MRPVYFDCILFYAFSKHIVLLNLVMGLIDCQCYLKDELLLISQLTVYPII